MSDIVVIGLGYVGLTSAVGFSSLGHSVIGIDTDSSKVELLESGEIHIYEPDLKELMRANLLTGRLRFSNSYDSIDDSNKLIFICVPTPSSKSGKADLSFVEAAINTLTPKLLSGAVIVIKSTVPIGTSLKFDEKLQERGIRIASNPEFFSEGTALFDFCNPSRLIVGAKSEEVAQRVMELYKDIDSPRLICGLNSAETIKHASNSFLALKLSFVNELSALCDATGASISDVTGGMSLDPRIGDKFLSAGPGWGGSCFPKDTAELSYTANNFGSQMLTVEAAITSNTRAKSRVADNIISELGSDVAGKKIAVWGLTFKANTDDTRDSPAVEIVRRLVMSGALVHGFDPMAQPEIHENYANHSSALDTCVDASALVILTEWDEFIKINPEQVKELMLINPYILDTRRILDPRKWSEVFSRFRAIGN
jgi:UDPglucose 6-dehydrogenase